MPPESGRHFFENGANMKKTNQLNGLNVLRLIAFLDVFLCHVLWAGGAYGVSLFFMMSGFLAVFHHLQDEDSDKPIVLQCITSLVKHVRKIYPIYLFMDLVIIFRAVQSNPLNFEFCRKIVRLFTLHALMLQSWFPMEGISLSLNGIGWYVSAIAFSWFMTPVILKLLRRIEGRYTHLAGIFGIVCLQIAVIRVACFIDRDRTCLYWLTYQFPLFRMGDYCIGCFVCMEYLNHKDKTCNTALASLAEFAILALSIAATVYINFIPVNHVWAFNLMWLPLAIPAVFIFAKGDGWVSRKISSLSVIAMVSRLSAYVFLFHIEILKQTGQWGVSNKYARALIAFVISLLLARIYEVIYFEIVTRKRRLK